MHINISQHAMSMESVREAPKMSPKGV